jgi:hypothetical protein
MSGMEPIIMGAVAGAALNRDDPMKGAMMGAALGGGAGALLGGVGAAGAAEAGALGAAEGAMAADAIPAFLANQPMGPSGLMPIDVFPVNAYPAAETIPVFNNEAIARASMGGDYTGIGSGASGSSMYSPFGGMIGYEEAAGKELAKAQAKDIMMRGGGMPSLGGAMNMLGQAQPRAGMQAPGIRRGQPQAVNYGGLASLLEPKLVERRRLSLL